MNDNQKEPSRQEIYNAVYEVLDSIEQKKEEVIKLFFELKGLPVDKATISRIKLIKFPENPDYSELMFDDEKVIAFHVNYRDSIPYLEVETIPELQQQLEEMARTDKDKLF